MAQKSKSSKDNDNSEVDVDPETSTEAQETAPTESESSDVPPGIDAAEAEATTDTEASAASDPVSGTIEETEIVEEPEEEVAAGEPEPQEDSLPEPAAVPPELTSSTPDQSTSTPTFVALVFGGLIAGALGYFGASFAPAPDMPEFDTTELTSSISANTEALSAVGSDIEALRSTDEAAADQVLERFTDLRANFEIRTDEILARQEEISDTMAQLTAELEGFDSRILALETALPTAGELQTDEELAALRQRISDMTAAAAAELETAQSEAASVARAAEKARLEAEAEAAALREAAEAREAELVAAAARQSALIDLKAAVESGAPYVDILETFASVPDGLAARSTDGVATMAVLQESFPEAARNALSQSTPVAEDASAGERLAAFLKRRTNARSLTEQDGDSADAILSRAEARLGEGDLDAAVREIDSLPQEAKAALSSWLDQATARQDALAAVDQLSATN